MPDRRKSCWLPLLPSSISHSPNRLQRWVAALPLLFLPSLRSQAPSTTISHQIFRRARAIASRTRRFWLRETVMRKSTVLIPRENYASCGELVLCARCLLSASTRFSFYGPHTALTHTSH